MTDTAKMAACILRRYANKMNQQRYDQFCEAIQGHENEVARAILNLGPPFNELESDVLAYVAGDMDDDHDFVRDGDLWSDDVLHKYAEHVFNYEYKYNDEALKVDPNTDTEQTHIGPMAQDLEKVNPAVVKEDPKSGYKTVDTGRLALMNAGAIADLAREIEELKNGR